MIGSSLSAASTSSRGLHSFRTRCPRFHCYFCMVPLAWAKAYWRTALLLYGPDPLGIRRSQVPWRKRWADSTRLFCAAPLWSLTNRLSLPLRVRHTLGRWYQALTTTSTQRTFVFARWADMRGLPFSRTIDLALGYPLEHSGNLVTLWLS